MKKEYPDILKLEGEKWHNPDPATGKLGTRVPAEWLQTTEDSLKSLTLEMLEVLKSAGINPNELNNTQVRDAIQKMILARVINYNDIQGRPVVKDSLGDDRNNPASQRVVNDVNRDVVVAQKTANTANDKANAAQNRADSAYNLAQTKQDKLTFSGTGNVARMSEVEKKRDLEDVIFIGSRWPEIHLKATALEGEGANIHLINDNSTFRIVYRDENDKDNMSVISFRKKTGVVALTSEIPTVAVDQIFHFESTTPPAGYIARNGQAIDPRTMPKLYARYGANMPDDRDRYLRMTGNLAGAVGGVHEDAMQKIWGNVSVSDISLFWSPSTIFSNGAFGVFENRASHANTSRGGSGTTGMSFDSARVTRTANETRVKSRIVIFCNKIQ